MVDYVPDRCEVIFLNFDPQAGTEIWGRRPALVLSPKAYNEKTSLALVVPITSKVKGNPFEVRLPVAFIKQVDGVILSDQLRSLDWEERRAEFVCQLPQHVVDDVIAKAQTLIL